VATVKLTQIEGQTEAIPYLAPSLLRAAVAVDRLMQARQPVREVPVVPVAAGLARTILAALGILLAPLPLKAQMAAMVEALRPLPLEAVAAVLTQ
jgi:hypothetical protein